MRITISIKFLLLFLFILFKNVILYEINKSSKNYYDEIDNVATTASSIFIKNSNNDNKIKYNNLTTKFNKSLKKINNLEAVNIIYNNNKINLSEINLLNLNINRNQTTNYEIPKPLNLKTYYNTDNIDEDEDEDDNDDGDNKNENLDLSNTNSNTFTFRHFGSHSTNSNHKSKGSKKPSLLNIALQNAARHGLEAMSVLYDRTEPDILRRRQILIENHPAVKLAKFNEPVDDVLWEAEKAAYATLEATKSFQRSYNRTTTELGRQATSTKLSFRRTALEGLCPPRIPPVCLPAAKRYRTHDGTCNNIKHPRWGSAQMPFNRFLPPEYGDGIDTVRKSVDGSIALSSARFVSLLVHGARGGNAPVTLILAQWGQLVDHDLTSTAQPRSINGSIPRCCGPNDFHPSCFPIKVPVDDPWLAPLKVRCLEFLRSAPAQRRDCVMSWREQTNQVTSYLDASPIYSSNARNSDSARIFRRGLLQFGRGNPNEDVCRNGAFSPNCIKSGDARSNEQPGLLALHHVWVGEHNRIATDLSSLNPHWSDEKVYQETRRIIGALFQHITYREFLPLVLGREVCRLFDLDLLHSGFYTGYDSHINPSVANSFSAAAFRFGHSLIPDSYIRCDQGHDIIQNNVSLHEEFSHGDIGTRGSLHRLLRGMVNQRALQRDEFITPELTNHLFQTGNFPFGLDLAAINIQRGRDHGIPPYTAWREPCGLSPINDWDDLTHIVGPESVRRMRHAYISVNDIDLFVGGIAERAVIGGLVGPTFACIIAQQFSNLRRGDRFWYENGGFENSFNPAQLNSIRRVSFAQVLCRATGGGTYQPHVFIPHEADNNHRLPCGTGVLANIDLKPWIEQDPFKSVETNLSFIMTSETNDIPLPIPNNQDTHTEDILTLTDNAIPTVGTSPTQDTNEKDPKANNILLNQIDFVPNGSTGFNRPIPEQRLQNQINDKLDFENNKLTTKRTPIINVQVVNNKLDSNNNFKTTTALPINRVTTKRKAFVNNVAIELGRTATTGQGTKKLKQVTEQFRNIDITKAKHKETKTETINERKLSNKTETRDKVSHVQKENQQNRPEKILEQTKDNYKSSTATEPKNDKNNDDFVLQEMEIDKTKNRAFLTTSTNIENKLLCQTIKNLSKTNLTNTISHKMGSLQTKCSFDSPNIEPNSTAEPSTDQLVLKVNSSFTQQTPLELRNVHHKQIGTENSLRKQNINIITATGEPNQEYEIEINIRKTNKNRNPTTTNFIQDTNRKSTIVPIRNDFNYLNAQPQQPQPTKDSPFSYKPIGHIRPIVQQNSIHSKIPLLQTTKPPKIYYVADEDNPFNRVENTTPRPGFFDNFFPSITGTFSGLFNSIQNLSPTSVETTTDESDVVTPPNRRVDMPKPILTDGTLINGIIQDNSNHGQPIFFQPVLPNNVMFDHNKNKKPDYLNINIRPALQNNNKPSYNNNVVAAKPIELTQFNNWNNHKIIPTLMYSSTENAYIDTRITTRRPYYDRPSSNQYRPTMQSNYNPHAQIYIQNLDQHRPYYSRHGGNTDLIPEHKNIDIQVDSVKSKIITRSANIEITTSTNKQNVNYDSESYDEDGDNDNNYYDNETTEDNTTEQRINEQFDKDGYLRPEHTLLNLQTNGPLTFENETLTQTTLNDNFVMPVLQTKTDTMKMKQPTLDRTEKPLQTLTDTIPRSPITDIKADTDQKIVEYKTKSEQLLLDSYNKSMSNTSSFNHWLPDDESKIDNSPLPVLPEFRINNEELTNELPKPMNISKWKKRFIL